MAKLKVSELFRAVQGEGRYAGTPSIFLRTFGCNFRCKSFGLTHGTQFEGPNPEVAEVIKTIPMRIGRSEKFADLPLVNTGCDTYAAVYPEFKEFSPMMTTADITSKMVEMLPWGRFNRDNHLILTGGEPLLAGWQKVYPELINDLREAQAVKQSDFHITFETNGTQEIDESKMRMVSAHGNLHFSVSPKLMASGELRADAIKPDVVLDYMRYGLVDFKFVVDDEESVDEVLDVLHNDYKYVYNSPMMGSVYLMPEGGTNEAYQKNQTHVANLALKYGLRFSPRLQNMISGNNWGT